MLGRPLRERRQAEVYRSNVNPLPDFASVNWHKDSADRCGGGVVRRPALRPLLRVLTELPDGLDEAQTPGGGGPSPQASQEICDAPLAVNPHRVGKPLFGPLTGCHGALRGTYRIFYRIDESRHLVHVLDMTTARRSTTALSGDLLRDGREPVPACCTA